MFLDKKQTITLMICEEGLLFRLCVCVCDGVCVGVSAGVYDVDQGGGS